MAIIYPWLRSFNYIEDFFRTLYDIYSSHYVPSYPVTYYSTDMDNSVMDNEGLMAGSYEKGGIGELSGMKWSKIMMLPVWGVENVQMTQESSEKGGMTFKEGASTQIFFPSTYSLKPLEGDIVNLSFGYRDPIEPVKMLFTVNNINMAHQSDFFQIYQLQLKMATFTLDSLEKQISKTYMFYDHEKKILPLANTKQLLKLQDMACVSSNNIRLNIFDRQTGFYLGD
jgi:hypothetical protein